MQDFKQDIKDKARNVAESAQDIARDKIDDFKKLNKPQQQLLIVFAALVAVVLLVYLLMPGKLNVLVSRIVMDGVMANQVVVQNNENKTLTKVKVTLNNIYLYEIPSVAKGETVSISVTDFKLNGSSPSVETVPKLVLVKAHGDKYLKDFSKEKP